MVTGERQVSVGSGDERWRHNPGCVAALRSTRIAHEPASRVDQDLYGCTFHGAPHAVRGDASS